MSIALAGVDRRLMLGAGLALIAGLAIGVVDASPGWDDTGITVFALLVGSAASAAVAGRRPWLIAILVGGFVPLLEIPPGPSGAMALVAFLFAGVGAGVGYLLGRVFEENR
jgi:hypothetical protein